MTDNSVSPSVRSLFARRLKQLRVPRGFPTARSFAQALNIDENRYTRYERAEVEPDLNLIAKICNLLGVTPNDLLDFQQHNVGFAEAPAPPPTPPGSEGLNGASTPRRALAWQLAEELAKLDGLGPSNAFDLLTHTCRLFSEIDADTFKFITQMAADPRLADVDAATTARIGMIAAQLVSALNSDILGAKARI